MEKNKKINTGTHKQKYEPPYHVVSQCFNVYILLKGRDIDKKEMRTQLKEPPEVCMVTGEHIHKDTHMHK